LRTPYAAQEADRVRKIALEAVPGCNASQGDLAHPTTLWVPILRKLA